MDNPSYSREMDSSARTAAAAAGGLGSRSREGSVEELARGQSTPVNRSFQNDDPNGFQRHPSTELLTDKTTYVPPRSFDANPEPFSYPPTINKDNLPNPNVVEQGQNLVMTKAPMKDPPKRSLCRSSMVLNVVLLTGIVTGIILCGCIAAESNLVYIGPVILGISVFGLCGKAYFTLFWEEDPLPSLNPYLAKVEEKIGCSKDPYGLKASSMNSGTQMNQMSYNKPTLYSSSAYPTQMYSAQTPNYNTGYSDQVYSEADNYNNYAMPSNEGNVFTYPEPSSGYNLNTSVEGSQQNPTPTQLDSSYKLPAPTFT